MADIQAVLSALEVFSRAPDKVSLDRANTWLQDFQHSPDAWTTCNVLLLSPDTPQAAKLFAAQTFRTKVTYDLHQVNVQNRAALRDTLVSALEAFQNGPRTIIVQLCLAIAGIALQLPSWDDPVQTLISSFGRNPATVPVLLQFLTLLPEEATTNTRIPISDDEYNARLLVLLSDKAKPVLELLAIYIQAPGVTAAVQTQVFQCLRNWLVAGEVTADDLSKTPLFRFAFEALNSDGLFEAAVEVVCELIHETQEIQDNMAAIELIVPSVIALKPKLLVDREDPEKIRGYARVFSEAGETYRTLIVQHPETFFPIVEAIGECSAYPDLDIVPITFQFWMRLAHVVVKRPSVANVFHEAYRALMGVIIRHLHFPPEDQALTGQEAEDFRLFRHIMGDTLKDCCYVLQADDCLLATYQLVATALARGPNAVTWQEIEAPLFAMRSMGAEVDPQNQPAIAKIFDLIPSLPSHPRVRYAALLIISRYTEWVNLHPTYIQPALQYIAAGFEDTDKEVLAAAGQALKYLCQDCKEHLVDVLPTLHNFLSTTGSKLAQEEKRQVYEAIAYVISAMPMERAASSLRSFSVDILAQIHNLTGRQAPPSRQELQEAGNALENLEVMLGVVKGFGEQLPAACENTCQEAWTVLDNFLFKYGSDVDLSERVTRVLRHSLNLFGSAALPIATSVMSRMSTGFGATGYPSFLWIAGKIVGRFGAEENPELRAAFRDAYQRATHRVVLLLQSRSAGEIPDVLEDYVHMLLQYMDIVPDVFFETSTFRNAFRVALAALNLIHTDIVFATLELFRNILTHDCLQPANGQLLPPNTPIYAAIQNVVNEEGYELMSALLNGLVGDFPEDATPLVVTTFRMLSTAWPTKFIQWLPLVIPQLPVARVPAQAKEKFLTDVSTAISNGQHDKVKFAILALNRASIKARERRRATEIQT